MFPRCECGFFTRILKGGDSFSIPVSGIILELRRCLAIYLVRSSELHPPQNTCLLTLFTRLLQDKSLMINSDDDNNDNDNDNDHTTNSTQSRSL